MKSINEVLTTEVQATLKGIYVLCNHCYSGIVSILPEETLTAETFGLINGDVLLTVEDFRWYSDNGSDRDFRYGDSNDYLSSDELPEEVVALLNGVIAVKFAKASLDDAKDILDNTDKNEAKTALNTAITAFEEALIAEKKLIIATDALNAAKEALNDADEYYAATAAENAATVIYDVGSEIYL